TTVECRRGGETAPATVESGGFTCSVSLAEGPNTIDVLAHDRSGPEAQTPVHVPLDTSAPVGRILDPTEGQPGSRRPPTVAGTVEDASPVTVQVEGVAAAVQGSGFTAADVPLGPGPDVVLHVHAEDAAGNTTDKTVTVRIDRTAPVVHITSPTAGAYLKTAMV